MLKKIADELYQFTDTCNVFIIKNARRALLIDFGSGAVMEHLEDLGIDGVDWILHTHHHREQCQGDMLAVAKGIKIAVPERESGFFGDAAKRWETMQRHSVYGAPYIRPLRYGIPFHHLLRDRTAFEWGPYRMIPRHCPGDSPGGMSIEVEIGGRKCLFIGDAVLSGAKIHHFYDCDWDYGYGAGLAALIESVYRSLGIGADIVCPSHGEIIWQPSTTLKDYINKLETLSHMHKRHWDMPNNYREMNGFSKATAIAGVREVTPRLLKFEDANMYVIMSETGKGLIVDAGCLENAYLDVKLAEIRKSYKLDEIKAVIPTHYHGDHLTSIPHLVKDYGAEVWCYENMAPILTNPEKFNLTCLLPDYGTGASSLPVHRVLRDGETVKWEEHSLDIFHLPGQTEFGCGIGLTIDGIKTVFTGDNMFHSKDKSGHDAFVARNGVLLENGYLKCAETLLAMNPDLLLGGHAQEIFEPRRQLEQLKDWAIGFRNILTDLSPYESYHRLVDPYWLQLFPYRQSVAPGSSFKLTACVCNHSPASCFIRASLKVPQGWDCTGGDMRFDLEPNGKGEAVAIVSVPYDYPVGTYIVTADIVRDGELCGELFDCTVHVTF